MANSGSLRILRGSDVADLLDLSECIDAVEGVFRSLGEGRATAPVVMGLETEGGGFHIKAGVLSSERGRYFVSKTNGNFPANPKVRGLPTIQGTVVVCDADCGTPLAIMDSIEITALRTAAATAVAARHLSNPAAATVGIIGCGLQGDRHLRVLSLVRRLRRARVYDVDRRAAEGLANRLTAPLGLSIDVVDSVADAARGVDLCVTCTPSHAFLLGADDVDPGTFVGGVGVDAPHKRELSPALMANSRVVVDLIEQCAVFGDLHHAIEAGVMGRGDVYADLGAVVAGRKAGWESNGATTVFDSTGMALQDAAAAVLVYERAADRRVGLQVAIAG